MRKIDQLLAEYGESHQHPTNKKVHWICVPLIFWSITGLLWSLSFPWPIDTAGLPLNAATIALGLAFIYYVTLSIPLAFGMLLYALLCLEASYLINTHIWPDHVWAVALIVFVLAWIGQFWGHKVEGKKPSFLKDLQFLLIGPAWLLHFLYKRAGLNY